MEKLLPFKLPLRIKWNEDKEDEEFIVDEIVDADGNTIIETDGGYYHPKKDEAEFIVESVNRRSAPHEVVEALEWYASKEAYDPSGLDSIQHRQPPVIRDYGDRARAALATLRKARGG